MKRKTSSESELSFDIDKFKNQTSAFGKYEEAALNIKIHEENDYGTIFSPDNNAETPEYLKHLELTEFSYNDILVFKPQIHPELSKSQRIFLNKLKYVLINNKDQATGRVEAYIQDLIDEFLRECDLEDGMTLYMMPSRLYLNIGEEQFAAYSDKEGRKNEEIVWIIEENKHKYDTRYKQGDIQIVSSLIAACQINYIKKRGKIEPKILYGIKVVGDEFYFYKTEIKEDYLIEISSDLPKSELHVIKYPKRKGLNLSYPEDRKKILYLIHRLKEYALSLPDSEYEG